VSRAVTWGLSEDPANRPASMHLLLAQLERALNASRWRGYLVAGVGVASITAVAVGVGMRSHRARLCEQTVARVDPAWSTARREAVRAAFLTTRRGEAETTFSKLASQLDRYAGELKLAEVNACEATRLRGEESEATMGLRVECLQRRIDLLKTLTDSLVPPT